MAATRRPRKVPAKPAEFPRAADPKADSLRLLTNGYLNLAAASNAVALAGPRQETYNPFTFADVPPGVLPAEGKRALAQDSALTARSTWAAGQRSERLLRIAQDEQVIQFLPSLGFANYGAALANGYGYLGYSYLAELAQVPEYRVISETIATELTREWIEFKSTTHRDRRRLPREKAQKIEQIEERFSELKIADCFRKVAEIDGFMGRGHLYLDTGDTDRRDELKLPIGDGKSDLSRGKVNRGNPLRDVRAIEATWCYPTRYNSDDPLKGTWYRPEAWFVMGKEVHVSRLLLFVGREVPDLLKPAYNFGGLSLSQMVKPYVDNWLRIRQAIADLIWSFSTNVLKTDLQTLLQGGVEADAILARVRAFNALRNNQGTMVINKDTEDWSNVAAPLSGLHELQAQAQEHMACLTADALVHTRRGAVRIDEVTTADEVMTREGYAPVAWSGQTGYAAELVEIHTATSVLRATTWHPIYTQSTGEFVPAESVRVGDILRADLTWKTNLGRQFCGEGVGSRLGVTVATAILRSVSCIARSGKRIAGLFQTDWLRTTLTRTLRIISCPTWNSRPAEITTGSTWTMDGAGGATETQFFAGQRVQSAAQSLKPSWSTAYFAALGARWWRTGAGTENSCSPTGTKRRAWNAVRSFTSSRLGSAVSTAVRSVRRGGTIAEVVSARRYKVPMQAVYNLEIAEGYLPEFYANGVLVHNSVSRIPLVKLLGIQPSGLNASSEGEIRAFYDSIAAYQEAKFRIPITTVLNFVQLSLFGEVDPEITFEFKPLWQLDEVAKAGVQQVRAATRETDYAAGFISAEEGREAIAGDPESQYAGIDLSAALAPGEVEEEEGEFDPAVDPAEVETEKLENHPKPKTAGRLPQSLTTKAATFGSPATGGFPDR